MKPVTLTQLAAWCGAAPATWPQQSVLAVHTDSRQVAAGSLFVALRGERVDGHDFLAAVLAQGAVAALVARQMPVDLPQLVVDDPLLALGRLAAELRRQRDTVVLALTGSNGKTSVKTLLHGILSRHADAYCNPGNRNNELGMPLALIDQPEEAAFAVYEMGAGQPGDIAYLADIAQPQVALVNNIGPAHLERMGSMLGVAQTKGAIYQSLREGGTAVINADDAFARWFEDRIDPARIRILRFGLQASAEVVAEAIRLDAAGARFRLCTPAGSIDVELPLAGRHNISNALAAASMALAVEVPLGTVAEALSSAQPVAGRQQVFRLGNGACLIDDSYNANPGSVAAAIATLAALPAPRWLVLGDMRELGADAERLHAEVGAQARAAGLDRLYAVGELSRHAAVSFDGGVRHYASQEDLLAALRADLDAGVNLLVKGSRGSRMDRVVDALLQRGETVHAA